MPQLRTIYISHAPRLVELPPDVFHVFLPSLKVLRIVHTGLTVLPGISQLLLNQGILHLLDLENNKIKRITTAAVSIRAIQLLLNNNSLQTVEASAFKGSEIDKLSMKGNLELTNLHPLAFQGIKSLTTLDLSSTAITRLPTEGLGGLETLILTGTHDLKIFPSVYSFQHITTAHLTYPYHCCAFKYPRLHDPAEHRKHEEFLRKMEKEFCVDVTSPTPKNSHVGAGWRRRRRGASSGSPASPVPSPDAEDQQEKQVISALSDPSPALSPAQYFSNTEVIAQRIPAVVTSSFGPSSSSPRPSSPRPALESRHRTPPVNQSPSSGGEVGRMQGRKTQVIMGETKEKDEEVVREGVKRKGEKQVIIMEDTNKEEEEEEEERLVKEGVKMEAPRVSAHSQVNKNHFHLGSGKLAHQVRGGAALSARLPRSFRHHNTSLPLPPMAPPGGADGWGVSVPQAESAARLNEPSGVLQSPSLHPENPEDDPDEDPLAYNPYHPGGFSAGVPGGFEDHGGHGLVPSGGFGEVVAPQEKPQEVPDTNQFFHRNEVTVSPVTTVCGGNLSKNYRDVQCFPKPDAFNPCEDIMGNLGLRLAVWVVVVTAVFGNLSVMIVLMSTRFKMTVSKFLMCNLAVADLCMGLYLLLIAAMDLHTIGSYFNSAIYWQNGPGCKVAGFLTVFASELSILTLTVITLERWYAITYAIHLNKRLRLSVAARVMVLAWLYALTMAALPLIGVSGYSKTSICLPMETSDTADQEYLLVLLVTNGLAFVLICVCYAKMYCSIAGNNLAANTSDTTVAKRMALLVFTDFACWAPIAFFGLTAVCGYPLISVTHAKFLLVFFYPLNSCANPYLYAILTKQYRRDLFLMLARHGFFTRRAMKYKGGCSTNTWPNQHHVCVSGGPGGGGSGGPSRRISTLTQITTCGEWRGRARDGSVESLPRQASPPRIKSISAELAVPLAVPQGGSDRRPSDVCRKLQPVAEVHDGRASPQPAATSGSPHPIKNCYARMSFTPEQEALLQRYASDRQSGAVASNARRRPSSTDSRDDPLPLSLYTPTTPDTITTPISPSLDHAV
ncbi:LOW QUALITY PROTEIN: follicle-stimulating hormone receptor-like [Scylla paramamosain]|uniref:LOW QUALITY PROTEIN: follicle-stimulating hormone receptor-like n=1 Tax=Scylla paramamosain TaxID=85552 RepID=UPI00308363AB